jgi:hypothetical protein
MSFFLCHGQWFSCLRGDCNSVSKRVRTPPGTEIAASKPDEEAISVILSAVRDTGDLLTMATDEPPMMVAVAGMPVNQTLKPVTVDHAYGMELPGMP